MLWGSCSGVQIPIASPVVNHLNAFWPMITLIPLCSLLAAHLTQRTCLCRLDPLLSFLWVVGKAPYTTGLHQTLPASERNIIL